ncbi:MAG: TlpA family protein disulfide reductase [Pyrinomonadaceae bacterium]|nr:TlpA family protein disulfide reductase [Pyrinomonadaceae bacterium]
MDYLIQILTIALSTVFLTSAIAKLIDFKGAVEAGGEFGIPKAAAPLSMAFLIGVEFAVSFCLLISPVHFGAALAAVLLLLLFSIATARLVIQGRSPECRCFGQLSSEPVGKSSLIRNGVFLVLAVAVALLAGSATPIGGDGSQPVFLILFALVGLLIASVLIALELRGRLDGMEDRLKGVEKYTTLLEMQESGDEPTGGLPIGTFVGDISIENSAHEPFAIGSLTNEKLALLMIFVGPDCLPCVSLAEHIPKWAEVLKDTVEIALISTADEETNIEKFGSEIAEYLYLQHGSEVSDPLKARWTPTALLVGPDGRIASKPAAGDTAITTLITSLVDTESIEPPLFVGEELGTLSDRFGQTIPEFELERLGGARFRNSDLLKKPTLVVFWSLTCQYCTEMLTEMLTWRRDSPELGLAIIADGDRRKLEETGLGGSLILDDNYKVSETFGMYGTPSAVIVDENGVVVSETAQGANDINLLSRGVFNSKESE